MRRREFIALAGGAAAVWPLSSGAQSGVPVIGFVGSSSPAVSFAAALRQGLKETGYIEGQNIAIEFRWSEGDYSRLPAFAADLVSRGVAVIVAGGPPAARAAKAATSTIPIVFTSGDDPVRIGLVPSLNSPGGNITGVYLAFSEMSAKKLGLLHDLLPQVTVVGALLNPNSPTAERQAKDLQTAAHTLGLEQIITLTKRYAMPTIYELRQFVDAGGLMSYGTNINDAYRAAGDYVGRILKGEKPADLPVVQEAKFELVINMKTAKTLGINISGNVLSLADEVIE
jgi:putative tryptophan/tyrosine transport system substrate-binding protein